MPKGFPRLGEFLHILKFENRDKIADATPDFVAGESLGQTQIDFVHGSILLPIFPFLDNLSGTTGYEIPFKSSRLAAHG